MRATIDFGIDLGTTNSCIARLNGSEIEVIRNNEGTECTPSAVWIDRRDRIHVGRRAKEQYETDEKNAAIEFKLQMGRATPMHFQRSGRTLRPEELSAEVLKSLLGDAQQHAGEPIAAAVITVPADFDLPQCDATRHAAQLAGLSSSPLLQEPIAAALAYGFRRAADGVFWMIYDLGGGTFDAAVIQVRGGTFRVVNHGGDKHLGGKLIDWAIVEHLLVPALVREHDLPDFRRGNPAWRAAFAKLKLAAEQAKIILARQETAEVLLDPLCVDHCGDRIALDCEIRRPDVEALIEPLAVRTINICRKILSEKRLGPGDLERVILVGGPTMTPYLRQRLTDARDGLGILLDSGVDPLTVVAKGAALFAGTQRLEPEFGPALQVEPGMGQAGRFTLQLEYQPIGADLKPLVGGKVLAEPGVDFTGFTIEFIEPKAHPPRRSGQIRLDQAGIFLARLWASAGQTTTFRIELFDPAGRPCATSPDRLTYTHGLAVTDPPLIHSLGVATADERVDIFIPKGTSLPARKRRVHRTAQVTRKGQGSDLIRIPVVEGENIRRADRNRLIGVLEIKADQLKRDVPAHTEIEVTIEIDASRMLRARAYIPLLSEEFEDVIKFNLGDPDLAELRRDVAQERERLDEIRRKAEDSGEPRVLELVGRIDEERMLDDLESALDAAPGDSDAADKCQSRLLDLRMAIDDVEHELELPSLIAKAEHELAGMRECVNRHGTGEDREEAGLLESETRRAMAELDPDALWRKVQGVIRFTYGLLMQQMTFLIGVLGHIEELRPFMRDPSLAEQLLGIAERAVEKNDAPALRATIRQLVGLLPAEQRGTLPGYEGTTFAD